MQSPHASLAERRGSHHSDQPDAQLEDDRKSDGSIRCDHEEGSRSEKIAHARGRAVLLNFASRSAFAMMALVPTAVGANKKAGGLATRRLSYGYDQQLTP
jgi:hypothetical protein